MSEHKYLDKPILSTILFIILLVIMQIPGAIVQEGLKNQTISGIVSIIVSFIAIWLFYRHFKGEFKGGLLKTDNFKIGIILLIPLIIFILADSFIIDPLNMNTITSAMIPLLIFVISAGIMEEVVFRGFIVSNLTRIWNEENKLAWIILFSGLSFGLIHFINVLGPNGTGASLSITIVQVISTFGLGTLLAAIFLRTGNLWIPIIGHGLNNFAAGLHQGAITSEGIMTATQLNLSYYIDIVVGIIFLIIAFYYIRKAKRSEIVSLWDEKWS